MSEAVIGFDDLAEIILEKVEELLELLFSNSLDSALDNITRTMIRRSYEKFSSSRAVAEDLKISQSNASPLRPPK
ncbi:hypothetical protein CSV67_14260 [Sporosarcina sp. P2]|uniref:hypothetical protein n=1 Tax=Sporosarcina sp. P2 TaxID=2048251 RepID=UPI000C1661AF|nr:hypothetical protein [Sporosarcina sp. P2]PID01360.1 hypothetical protein CSV67_14260 [Sporosarcina sp. P2]